MGALLQLGWKAKWERKFGGALPLVIAVALAPSVVLLGRGRRVEFQVGLLPLPERPLVRGLVRPPLRRAH